MKIRKFKSILFILGIGISISFFGCNNVKNTTDNVEKNVEQGINNSKNNSNSINKSINKNIPQFTESEISIDNQYLINELNKKGFDAKKIKANPNPYDELFSVPQEEIQVNGGYISIYQYGVGDKLRMVSDFNSLNNNAYLFSQNKGNWVQNFHLYKKGRIFVVYDGADQKILTALSEILGKNI
ncbi:hypothetical protein [Clostridium thermobutyricum]|uniref:hypothetical protein n=1 Tax=Clostridium thermobutyricum TaxID=29372 RepID=UPI0018ABEDDB|nr:hypothetical protein [Clostridium thermobutyricum]